MRGFREPRHDSNGSGANLKNSARGGTVLYSKPSSLKCDGPGGEDGIDHDYDTIYILVKPKINLALSHSTAMWSYADQQQRANRMGICGRTKRK
jgi:hypothetical protein